MSKESAFPVGGAGLHSGLLVVGKDVGFSDRLMSYALDIAGRMGYHIIAVNIYLYPGIRRYFSEEIVNIADEEQIKGLRDEGVACFRTLADERSIPFTAQARVGEFDDVIREIANERGDIDLIVVEPEYVGQEGKGPSSIPAFSLAPEEE